jgi:PTS system glucitol/sorbitol-specific IIA component
MSLVSYEHCQFYAEVVAIGELAQEALEDNMIILFNDAAPSELTEYCFIHHQSPVQGEITLDSTLLIDDTDFVVTAIGLAANKNLQQLGHITIKFDGSNAPELPGCIHVLGGKVPDIQVGSKLVFG